MVNDFEEEVKALEEYGHDCCARIDDRIHECCKRIREAHEQELENTRYAHETFMTFHHYHAPTVEDVLREMHAKLDEVTALYVGEVIDSDERDRDEARIFAEYAAKLRLVDGEDA